MSQPTTAFEDSVDSWPLWTTLADEQTFLTAVADGSARMSYQQVGTSEGGRRIDLIRVGYPSAPTDQQLQAASVMFINGLPHGPEPSGREALFQFVRDLAYTADASLTGYLTDHPLLVIPTTNPDGRTTDAGKRNNDSNRDINRDYLRFRDAEAQTVGQVLGQFEPDLLIDCHEVGSIPLGTDFYYGGDATPNANADTEVMTLIGALNGALAAAWQAEGFTTGPYPTSTLTNTFRGHGTLRHRTTILIEAYGSGNTDGITRKQAVQGYLAAFHAAIGWHETNAMAVAATPPAAAARKTLEGRDKVAVAYPSIDPGPAGYRLTPAQAATTTHGRSLVKIGSYGVSGSDDIFVSMAQPAQPIIPLMLDSAANANVVAATRLSEAPVPDRFRGVPRDGVLVAADASVVRDGALFPAT